MATMLEQFYEHHASPRDTYRVRIGGKTMILTYILPGYEDSTAYDFPSAEAVAVLVGLGAKGWTLVKED